MLGSLGIPEIILILVAAFFLFKVLKPGNIPKFGRDIGQGIKEFTDGIKGGKEKKRTAVKRNPVRKKKKNAKA